VYRFESDLQDELGMNRTLYITLAAQVTLQVVSLIMRLASDNAAPSCVAASAATTAACIIPPEITNRDILRFDCLRQQGCTFKDAVVDDTLWVQNLLMCVVFIVGIARHVCILKFLPLHHPVCTAHVDNFVIFCALF
jgi:hypothetical protein